jgi:hypothetical protein
MAKHPDIEFYDFVRAKFFNGTRPIKISMPALPAYDYREYAPEVKLNHLISVFLIIAQHDSSTVSELGKFLIKKILAQEARRRDFSFARLKSTPTVMEDADQDEIEDLDALEEDHEETMFMAYDIDMDDMEDNLDGDLD